MSKAFYIRLAVFFLPTLLVWFLVSSRVIVPLAVGINELWVLPTYDRYASELVQTDKQEWRLKTKLFQANKPYVHNSYHPQLKLDGATFVELGSFKSLTLCLPLFWLLVLAYKPNFKSISIGSLYLFLLIVFMVGLNLFYQITKSLVEGDEMLRVLKSGYVFVPERPPEWLPKLLKPLVDVVFNLLILAGPIMICLKFYWQDLKHLPGLNQQTRQSFEGKN